MQLPNDITIQEFDKHYRLQPELWHEAIHEVCGGHKIPTKDIVAFKEGSNLVAAVGKDYVVKIFPKFHRHQWESEWRFLKCFNALDLAVPMPFLVAHGERQDKWTYVIVTRLAGVTLESSWPKYSELEKAGLLFEIGKIMRSVHSVDVGDLADLEPNWGDFLAKQAQGFLARHKNLGMPAWFLAEAEAFVAAKLDLLPNEKPVILTGEYTPFNLLGEKNHFGRWQISGMFDFGDAMVGFREYDFLGPCLFLGEGNPRLIASFFSGYKYANPSADKSLRDRLMLLAILHRYSNLKRQICIPDWQGRVKSLTQLQDLLWPLAQE